MLHRKLSCFLLAVCILQVIAVAPAFSQRSCGEKVLRDRFASFDPAIQAAYKAKREAMLLQAQTFNNNTAAKTTAQYPIPIVFHIILTQYQFTRLGGNAGIAQRVDSQMRVLNRDFTKTNPDLSSVPTPFVPLIGNAGIKFGLATKNPQNQPSVGYEIKILAPGVDSFYDANDGGSEAKYNTSKGLAAWDNSRYLNIWVVRLTDNQSEGVLGLTLPPSFTFGAPGFPVEERGIVLSYGVFGKRNLPTDYYFLQANPPLPQPGNGGKYDKGRTLTHEMGHYFELEHIWGTDFPTATCTDDDGIGDTPVQLSENGNCPAFPHLSCSNGPNGDMFMNFMDYVDDACMQMLTMGQTNAMNTQIQPNAPSYSLTQQPGLANGIFDDFIHYTLDVYPNPATDEIRIALSGMTGKSDAVNVLLINAMGQTVFKSVSENNKVFNVPVGSLPRGLYYVHCSNADGRAVQKIVLQ